MTELAFDTSKCSIPAIPKIPEINLSSCDIPMNFPVLKSTVPTISPEFATPPIEPVSTGTIGTGIATQDIPVGSSGVVTIYNCGVATDDTITVTARLNPIKSGDRVYFARFDCGSNDVVSSPCTYNLAYGTLQTTLYPGQLTTPTTASVLLYDTVNGVVQNTTNVITAKNYLPALQGVVGDTVLLAVITCSGVSQYTVIAATTVAATTTFINQITPCGGCANPNLFVMQNHTYPYAFGIQYIPSTMGGGSTGLVPMYQVTNTTWESDHFNYACAGGTDAYFWRLTLASASTCGSTATLTLVKAATTLHCTDLTTGVTAGVYRNIEPFRVRCSSRLVLTEDVCASSPIRKSLPCSVCIAPLDTNGNPPPVPPPGPAPTPTPTPLPGPTPYPTPNPNSSAYYCWNWAEYNYGFRSTALPQYLFLDISNITITEAFSIWCPFTTAILQDCLVNTSFTAKLHDIDVTGTKPCYYWSIIGDSRLFDSIKLTTEVQAQIQPGYSFNMRYTANDPFVHLTFSVLCVYAFGINYAKNIQDSCGPLLTNQGPTAAIMYIAGAVFNCDVTAAGPLALSSTGSLNASDPLGGYRIFPDLTNLTRSNTSPIYLKTSSPGIIAGDSVEIGNFTWSIHE